MLAVDSKMYDVPEWTGTGWRLQSKGESSEVILVDQFKWTLAQGHTITTTRGGTIEGRATFEYNCKSVKPSVRTLRVYGAERLGPIVSYLASRKCSAPVESGEVHDDAKEEASAIRAFFNSFK